MSYAIVPEKESLVVLVRMLSINEVNFHSLFNQSIVFISRQNVKKVDKLT